METEDLIITDEMREQLCSEQIPEIVGSYELMKRALEKKYSSEFVESHPEVAASLTVALEMKQLAFLIGESIEKQTDGIVGTCHYLQEK